MKNETLFSPDLRCDKVWYTDGSSTRRFAAPSHIPLLRLMPPKGSEVFLQCGWVRRKEETPKFPHIINYDKVVWFERAATASVFDVDGISVLGLGAAPCAGTLRMPITENGNADNGWLVVSNLLEEILGDTLQGRGGQYKFQHRQPIGRQLFRMYSLAKKPVLIQIPEGIWKNADFFRAFTAHRDSAIAFRARALVNRSANTLARDMVEGRKVSRT